MIIYFLLISVASLVVGVEFIADTHGKKLKDELLSGYENYSQQQIDEQQTLSEDQIFAPISRLRSKAVLMIVIILFVVVIVLTMFIKNITEPLQHMIEQSREISRGDLSRAITIHTNNELAELGNVINEMSSNLQEIILISGNMCAAGKTFINTTESLFQKEVLTAGDMAEIRSEITHLKSEMNLLSEMIKYFNFYTVEKQNDQ